MAVVSGRAAMELANRFLLKCIQEEDARLHEDAQRTLARFYRSITRRRRLHAAATLLKARSLAVTIQIRVWKKRFASRKLQRFLKETAWAIRIRTARRKYFRAVRLFQRLFRAYNACTRARKLAMRRVWDACEGKAEETARRLRKAAEAAAARAKEDPRPSPRRFDDGGSRPRDPRRAPRAAWRRRKAELVKAAREAAAEAARRGTARRPFPPARHRRDASITHRPSPRTKNLEPDGRKSPSSRRRRGVRFGRSQDRARGRLRARTKRPGRVRGDSGRPTRAHGERYASKIIARLQGHVEGVHDGGGVQRAAPAAEAVRKAHEWPPVAFLLGCGRKSGVAFAAGGGPGCIEAEGEPVAFAGYD